jgi:hypothetical protein
MVTRRTDPGPSKARQRAKEPPSAPPTAAPMRIGVCFMDRGPGGAWVPRQVWLDPSELAPRWVRLEPIPEGGFRQRVWVLEHRSGGPMYREQAPQRVKPNMPAKEAEDD